MKITPLASVATLTLSAGIATGGYFYFRPSSLSDYLIKRGHKLASSQNENLWKSIYEENKESFDSVFSSSGFGENEKWKAIKNYCNSALKKKDYSLDIEKVTKWCVDNVQTIKGQIIKEGLNLSHLMINDNQYRAAVTFEGNKDFLNLIGPKEQTLKSKIEAYKKWCVDSLEKSLDVNLVKQVINFCKKKPYSNFNEKLATRGYQRLSTEDIKKKYDALNLKNIPRNSATTTMLLVGGDDWKKNLGIDDNNWTINKSNFEKLYIKFCETGDKEDFSKEEANYLKLFSEYEALCAKKKN